MISKIPYHQLTLLKESFCISKVDKKRGNIFNTNDIFAIIKEDSTFTVIHHINFQISNLIKTECTWKAIKIKGKIEFSKHGILKQLLSPIASAGIGVLCYSSYDTDYIFVKKSDEGEAVHALSESGYNFYRDDHA